jgi:hypothetical protein
MGVEKLFEQQVGTRALRVDRDAGVIFGVRVIGPSSTNGRVYPAATLSAARGLYENSNVHCNHPRKGAGSDRPIEQRIGWLKKGLSANFGESELTNTIPANVLACLKPFG